MNRHFSKGDIQINGQQTHENIISHESLRKCRSKPQWGVSSHPLGRLKSKRCISVGKDMENLHTLLVGMQNDVATLEKSCKSSKSWAQNYHLTQQFHFRVYNQENWNMHLHKNYMNVHSKITHNSQKVETTQMSINWWMNYQNVAYSHNVIIINHKKEWTPDSCYNMDKPWKHYAKWEAVRKDHVLYDLTYRKCPELANPERHKIN